MDRERFSELVAEAIESLPPQFLEKMDNVEVVIEGWPSREALLRAGLPPGQTLFGLYEGIPLTKRTSNYGMVLPDKITIYQGPIEACFRTPEEIRRQVQKTVIHEIAHHFGIDDERLDELGW